MKLTVPAGVRYGVEAALKDRGKPAPRIREAMEVGGGCINPAARVELEDGSTVFVKWNEDPPPGFFSMEAQGLRALRDVGSLRVPEVLGVGEPEEAPAWLLLEFIPRTVPGDSYGSALGRGLANLHEAGDGGWGWDSGNYIGSLPQSNRPLDRWTDFWREERLLPQLDRARSKGHFTDEDGSAWDRVLDRLDELLEGAEDDGPSLLHGDLWSGNVYPGPGGEPVLIDPAVYRGHREVDLAMTELFGGFPDIFMRTYREAWPVDEAYDLRRRDVYQLYPLLAHVNLFGESYVPGTMERVRRLLGA